MEQARILVVEDEAIVARDIRNRIRNMGYEVAAVAHTGEEAILRVEEEGPDLVLMDIRLRGDMDGIEAAQAILDRWNIPVVYLTAYTDQGTLDRAKITHPLGYLIKPFEDRDLAITIDMALYRHRTEKSLRESEAKLRTIFDQAKDEIVQLDANGIIVDVNRRVEDIFGYLPEEVIGKSLLEIPIFTSEVMQEMATEMGQAIDDNSTVLKTFEAIRKNGSPVFIEASASLLGEGDGEPGVLAILRDVTERVRAEMDTRKLNEDLSELNATLEEEITERRITEEALRESQERWKSLAENAPAFVTIVDRDNVIEYVNYPVSGFELEDVISHSVYEFIQPEYHDIARKRIESVFATGQPCGYESVATGPDGTLAYYDNRLGPIISEGHIIAVSLFGIDITERKQAEDELRESEKRFRELAHQLPQSICETDNQGLLTFANSGALEAFGYSLEEFEKGLNILDMVVPEDRDQGIELFSKALTGESPEGEEYTARRQDGNTFPIMIWVRPLNRSGEIHGLRAVAVDITAQKQVEREAARAEALEELNQLKDTLVASVSHELRTPLTSIKGYANTLVQPDIEWDHEIQQELLHAIEDAADRLTYIVNDLIDISQLEARTIRLDRVPIKVSAILSRIHDQLTLVAGNHQFEITVSPDLPAVYCDEVRIGQVITNLISNAAAYSDYGTRITLGANQVNGTIEVNVVDEGIGIPEGKRDRIFDRFYRLENAVTHRKGGTGLGLAICRGIIDQHGGRIWVESREGHGSRFSFSLPTAEDIEYGSDIENLMNQGVDELIQADRSAE